MIVLNDFTAILLFSIPGIAFFIGLLVMGKYGDGHWL